MQDLPEAPPPPSDTTPPTAPDDIVVVEGSPPTGTDSPSAGGLRRAFPIALVASAAMLAVLVILAIVLAGARSDLSTLQDEVAELHEDLSAFEGRIGDVDSRADDLDTRFSDLDTWLTAVLGSSPTDAIPTNGDLPPFEETANDLAVLTGMSLAEIGGTEYYTDTEVSYAPDDGVGRVWMLWAHWCPHCQAELPELTTWYAENADRFPHSELVTVSTAIDETRDNPLIPYLDESAFPFPVVVDSDGTLATRFGATVFPFWVVTDADGAVLVRVGGRLEMAQIEEIFTQLEALGSGG